MTSKFNLPFLTLFVYLFLLSASPGLSQAASINDLENQLFFRQYDGENDTARLSRIENYIFGQTYSDSVENRIARIKAAVPANQDARVPAPQNPTPQNPTPQNSIPQNPVPSNNVPPEANSSAPAAQTGNDDNGDAQSQQLKVMEARANQVNTLLGQAVSLYRQKQFKEAIDLLEQVIRIDPQNASAHFSLGIALEANGNLAQAASEYGQAAAIDPNGKDYNLAVQNIKNRLDQENTTKTETYKWQLLASQAADALKSGQLDQALTMYTQLVEKDPHQALYQYNLGTVYLLLKRPDDALPHYKSAHKLEPSDTVYEQSLQKLEQSKKEAKQAKEVQEKAAKPASPKKIDPYANFGLEVKQSRLGVMVKKLKPGWRAAQVGLSPEDIIKTVDGIPINTVSQLEQTLANKPIGERFQMMLIRRGMACQLLF